MKKKYVPEKIWKTMLKHFPMLVVDGVVVKNNQVLLLERKKYPYLRHCVLPGGFVDKGETVEKAVVREVYEETGLRTRIVKLVGVYSNLKRDPRGHSVSVTYLLKPVGGRIRESDETKNIRFFPVNKLPNKIGFDHRVVIKDALKLLRKGRN